MAKVLQFPTKTPAPPVKVEIHHAEMVLSFSFGVAVIVAARGAPVGRYPNVIEHEVDMMESIDLDRHNLDIPDEVVRMGFVVWSGNITFVGDKTGEDGDCETVWQGEFRSIDTAEEAMQVAIGAWSAFYKAP